MIDSRTKLYDAFGELIYVLAMADGGIQEEEISTLEELLSNHPWSSEIIWSFDYESRKQNDLEDVYKKVIQACKDLGPHAEYESMIEVMEAVAESSLGIVEEEQALIDRFRSDLTTYFKEADLD